MTFELDETDLRPSYSVYVGISRALPRALAFYTIPISFTFWLAPTLEIDLLEER